MKFYLSIKANDSCGQSNKSSNFSFDFNNAENSFDDTSSWKNFENGHSVEAVQFIEYSVGTILMMSSKERRNNADSIALIGHSPEHSVNANRSCHTDI